MRSIRIPFHHDPGSGISPRQTPLACHPDFFKVLRAGVGKTRPTDKSIAVVKYQPVHWELFDSTPDAIDGGVLVAMG